MRPPTSSSRLGPLYEPPLDALDELDGLLDLNELDLELEPELELVERLFCVSSPWLAVGEEESGLEPR